jgi:ABC-type protease/lipase transport system fused ATPase/permease subunit
MTVSSLAKGTQQSPHAIAEIMKFQNKSFIAVAGKVAAIHDEIEKLKESYISSYGNKTIKLTGTYKCSNTTLYKLPY